MTSGVAVPMTVLTAMGTIFTLTVTNQAGATAKRSLTITVLGFGTTSSPMVEARAGHTATLLADGTVLLTGGEIGSGSLATAEIFDPATGAFFKTKGDMDSRCVGHTATMLAGGKVLIAGGNTTLAAEFYDPPAGTFTVVTSPMTTVRTGATATLVGSGKVLIAGGSNPGVGVVATAQVNDPATGTFATPALAMTSPRMAHTSGGGGMLLAEVFDATGVSTRSGQMMVSPRWKHTATPLASGQVLIAGGLIDSSTYLSSAELYAY